MRQELVQEGDKQYIGDGLYVRWDGFGIWVTAENGISVLNEVYLEPSVYRNLKEFAEARFEGRKNGKG